MIMNIFYLDKRPDDAAEMHCDKHCVKMILEYAQMLSTAHRVLDEIMPIQTYTKLHIKITLVHSGLVLLNNIMIGCLDCSEC